MPGDACPICDAARPRHFLSRPSVAVHQNLLAPTRADAIGAARGDLDFAACEACGFVFNAAFDPAKLAYGAGYDNNQGHSPFFADYLDALADRLVNEEGVKNARIVEVGCGRGDFLRKLVEDPAHGNTGVGFDPAYRGPDHDLGGRLRFERRYYDASAANVAADVVVCRHVIEHVARPMELLRAVRAALAGSTAPRVFFETPCVEWILANAVIWDFFYEHCSLFSRQSLRTAFERANFAVRSLEHAFGGQYLWAEAALGNVAAPERDAGEIVALAERFAKEERRSREEWSKRVRDLAKSGKIAIWGAGAKGVTFAQLVDADCTLVDCLVDLNPNKQGKFTPGTGHPIVGVRELAARGVAHAILMNPNYRAENEALLARENVAVNLIG